MRPEVPAVLAEIKKMGLRIGCISNTQSLTQVPTTLEKYGISQYFDPVVLSSKYGRRKPDPAIFYHAARLANSPTGACGYVGDKINRDVLGAKKAGFKLAIQVRHEFDDGEVDEGAEPDAIIENLADLLPLLEASIREDRSITREDERSRIKAVFFDAGDILYYRPQRDKYLNEFLSGHQLNPVPGFEDERKRIKDLAFSGQMRRHDYYRELIRLYGITDEQAIEQGMEALSRDDDTVAIFDGVPETVHALKERGFILGIITDTAMPITRKLNWFEKHGFGRVWDVMISSKEIGVRKPAPSMYEEALQQTGIRPQEAVFVGHKTHELEGARAVGLKTIAFNYDPDAPADFYIEHFQDLLNAPLLAN
jgi:HAD superfamily hydrolase (TIGR01509 family)